MNDYILTETNLHTKMDLTKIYFLGLHSPEKRGELQEISRPYSKKSLSRPVFPERRAESSMSDDKAGRTPSPRIIAR